MTTCSLHDDDDDYDDDYHHRHQKDVLLSPSGQHVTRLKTFTTGQHAA